MSKIFEHALKLEKWKLHQNLILPFCSSCKCLLFENVVVLAGFLKAQTAPKAEKFNKNLRFHQNLPCLSDLVEKF